MDVYKSAPTKSGVPIDHLDYSYIEKCSNIRELEKILKELRSGNEGFYPELEKFAETKLEKLAPSSKALRKEQPIPSSKDLGKQAWEEINSDLETWSKEMESVAKQPAGLVDLPPVRGAQNSININKGTSEKSSVNRTTPVKPRDYREWDKLDVEAELSKVDDDKKNLSNPELKSSKSNLPHTLPVIDTTNLTDQEKYQKAEHEKNKGNEAFRSGDFEEALLYYDRSISLVPTAASHNNRAQTYVKLKRWHSAVTDCNTVLKMEPSNIKAFLRRAVAYQGQHELTKAASDLRVVLTQEPANKRAKDLMAEVEKDLAEQKVKGRRIVIEEVQGSDDESGEDGDEEEERKRDNLEQAGEEQCKTATHLKEETSCEQQNQQQSHGVPEQTRSVVSKGNNESEIERHSSQPAAAAAAAAAAEQDGVCNENKDEKQVPAGPTPLPNHVSKLKEQGNQIFRNGHYGDAIGIYTDAINALLPDLNSQCPNLAVLYNNRAACKHKIGDCSGCVKDCTLALELTPGAPKPLVRRAMAFEALEKFRDAYVDYRQVLTLDSSIDVAQQGSSRCSQMLQQLDGANWREKLPKVSTILPSTPCAYPTPAKSEATRRKELHEERIKQKQLEAKFIKEKDLGNTCVKQGDFNKAVEHYSECVKCCPDKAVAYTNRALCYLRLNMPGLVVDDCNQALSLDFENAKGLFRRAQAYKMEGKYEESLIDLQTLLKIDPRNAAAKSEMATVEKYKTEHESRRREEAAKKRVLEQGQHRVPLHIEEVEGSSSDEEEQMEAKPISANMSSPATPNTETSHPEQSSGRQPPVSQKSNKHTPDKHEVKNSTAETPTTSQIKASTPTLNKASPYEFVHAWTSLKGVKDILPFVELIQQVSPKDFPKVISNKLDGEMLMTIVQAMDTMIINGRYEEAHSYLAQLAKVPRFNMVTMFMSASDKQVVKMVFRKLKQAESNPATAYTDADLQKTMTAYGL